MGVPSKIHNIPLVQVQPEERLAVTSELNFASCQVTGCGEVKEMGYGAAMQVKGLSHEIFIVPEADLVHVTEGRILIADSLIGTWRGGESRTGSETVALYQTDIMVTREAQSVLLSGVCPLKPIKGKIVQTTLWDCEAFLIKLFKRLTDQPIVPEKQSNARGRKVLAVEPFDQGHFHRTKRRIKDGNKTGLISYPKNDRVVLLKSQMRENLKSCSAKGLIAASGRRWL